MQRSAKLNLVSNLAFGLVYIKYTYDSLYLSSEECGVSETSLISRLPAVRQQLSIFNAKRHSRLRSILKRRSSANTAPDLEAMKKQLQDEMKESFQLGPPISDDYNPNHGYEPYWIGGDWVLEELQKNKTEGLCGSVCGTLYLRYGEICGRDKHHNYLSFKNYCAMKTHDCDDKDNWLIAYRGPCRVPNTFKTYGTKSDLLQSRAHAYVSDYLARVDATTLCYHPNPFKCLYPNMYG